jgi:selenocysteine lyase/cysteine desulfurase
MQRTFDVTAVREQFPALERKHAGRRVVYLDGPGGSQVVKSAIDAVTHYMSRGGANLHGAFPTSVETEEILHQARQVTADFLGAGPDEVAFGANMTTLTFSFSRSHARGMRAPRSWSPSSTTARTWTPGSSPPSKEAPRCAGSGSTPRR